MIRNFNPQKSSSISGMNSIRTYDVERKIWEYLKRYQSKSFVQKRLKQKIHINTGIINEKADQISALMVQGENYYKLAQSSGPEIKPLILYYGMVGLSKILILDGDNHYTLRSIYPNNNQHGTHGLTVTPRGIPDQIIRDGNHISAEYCYVATSPTRIGLFNLLRKCYSNSPISNGIRITVK